MIATVPGVPLAALASPWLFSVAPSGLKDTFQPANSRPGTPSPAPARNSPIGGSLATCPDSRRSPRNNSTTPSTPGPDRTSLASSRNCSTATPISSPNGTPRSSIRCRASWARSTGRSSAFRCRRGPARGTAASRKPQPHRPLSFSLSVTPRGNFLLWGWSAMPANCRNASWMCSGRTRMPWS